MRIITKPRPSDDLSSFGTLLHFEALIYSNEQEGQQCRFDAGAIEGDIAFPLDMESAEQAFKVMANALTPAEDEFLEHGNQEGFVALFNTPKGIMLIAASSVMGFNGPDLGSLLPGAKTITGMPYISWPRILKEMFPNEN